MNTTAQAKPQPDSPQYPVSALFLYTEYDRASWLAATGKQAPPFDPAKPLKTWCATDISGPYTGYNDRAKQFEQFTAPEPGVVNLPGAYEYPRYIAPTTTVKYNFFGTELFLGSGNVCRKADAEFIAAELGGTVIEDTSGWGYQYSDIDAKVYQIRVGQTDNNAGHLAAIRFAQGYKRPGHWENDFKKFVPDQPPTDPAPGGPFLLPVPCRKLLPNERLVGMGLNAVIQRTDKQGTTPEGGSFSDADRHMLTEVHGWLQALAGKMGL